MCKACSLHKERREFTLCEWAHTVKPSKSEQGKCKGCAEKAEKDMWQCRACKQTLHKTEYSTWCGKHISTLKRPLVRCNSCMYQDEQQQKLAQAQTFAMVMKPGNSESTKATYFIF